MLKFAERYVQEIQRLSRMLVSSRELWDAESSDGN